MMTPTFELVVQPTGERDYMLSLKQLRNLGNGRRPTPPRVVSRLGGVALQACADQLLEVLRRDGHRPTALTRDRAAPIALSDESGVRLGLLFLALRPLSKLHRMEMVTSGVRHMPPEEAYYWFSKCSATNAPVARRAQHALRVLLAPE